MREGGTMSTNITTEHREAFAALSSGTYRNLDPQEGKCDETP
jgi:hypothetical protein